MNFTITENRQLLNSTHTYTSTETRTVKCCKSLLGIQSSCSRSLLLVNGCRREKQEKKKMNVKQDHSSLKLHTTFLEALHKQCTQHMEFGRLDMYTHAKNQLITKSTSLGRTRRRDRLTLFGWQGVLLLRLRLLQLRLVEGSYFRDVWLVTHGYFQRMLNENCVCESIQTHTLINRGHKDERDAQLRGLPEKEQRSTNLNQIHKRFCRVQHGSSSWAYLCIRGRKSLLSPDWSSLGNQPLTSLSS